jgi:hypothetical protein
LDNACESQFVKDPAALKPSRNPLKKRWIIVTLHQFGIKS